MYRKHSIKNKFLNFSILIMLASQLLFTPYAYADDEWKPDRKLANELINLPEDGIEQAFKITVPEKEKADYALMTAWRQIFKLREYSKAKVFLKLAENELSKQTARNNDWSTFHMLHLTLSRYTRDYDNVIVYGKQALKYLDGLEEQKIGRYAYILDAMSDAYYTLGDYESSLNSSLKIVDKARSAGNEKEEANALFAVAESSVKLSRLDEGESAANRAFDLYKKLGNTKGLGHAKKVLGSIYKSKGDLDKAKQSYYAAFEYYKKVSDHHGAANCLYNIGHVHVKTKDYGEAVMSYESAAFHYIRSGSAGGAGMAKMELGKVRELMNSLDKAELLYEEARSLLTKSNSMARLAQLEYYYADLYKKQGKANEAKDSYLRALKIYRKANNKKMITWIEKQINRIKGGGTL